MSTLSKSSIPRKTPAGRSRRRKPAKSGTSEGDNNKENSDLRSTGDNNTNGRKSLGTVYLDDDNDVPSFHIKINTHSSSNKEKDGALHKDAIQEFQQSLRQVTVPKSSLWEDHPERLAKTVMGSSLTQCRENNGSFLFLDKYVSSLLSFSRKLIKDVADKKSNHDKNNKSTNTRVDPFNNLFVAVHILRSLVFVLADSISVEKKETLLKLLYHLISTAGESCLIDDQQIDRSGIRLGLITMAGYEGLGYALSNYSTIPNHQRHVITFEIPFASNTGQGRIAFFPVPCESSPTNKYDSGNMGIRQLCTVAFKTTAVVARLICNLFGQSTRILSDSSDPSMYGSLASAIENWTGNIQEIAISILTAVQSPWFDLLGRINNVEKDVEKEFISYAKGAHRILWDAASNLKSGKSSKVTASAQNRVESLCLELRKNAILLLLPETSFQNVNKLVRKSFLECAFTYSWKAATIFYQNTEISLFNSQLTSFYESVDARLQFFLRLESAVPLEYSEYFAFKALHTRLFPPSLPPPFNVTNITSEPINAANTSSDYRLVLDILQMATWSLSRIEYSLHFEATSKTQAEDKFTAPEVIGIMDSLVRAFT
jgi:hypothetical protein